MALVEIKNHADLAVRLLLEQLKGKEKLEAFLRALVGPIQDMEEVAHDLDTEMRLDNAAGAQLDMIGRIVNLARGSLGDEAYRTRLHARIRANRSEGTPDDVLAVLRLMVAVNALSIEEYPTGMVARIAGTLAEDPDAIVAELRRARPGAVPLHLEYTLAADADTFTFADGDSEEMDSSAGFSGMRWIAAGNDAGTAAYIVTADTDVTTWTQRTNPQDDSLKVVASDGNGTLIAAGDDDGTDPYLIRSTDDGATWSEMDLPDAAFGLRAVVYSPELDLWAAGGLATGSGTLLMTSDDGGVSWTQRTAPADRDLYGMCWSSALGLFVGVGETTAGSPYIVTSPDGIAWTQRYMFVGYDLYSVCWSEGLGLLVAVGAARGSYAFIATSPDGSTWTARTNPKNLDLYGVCWSEVFGILVAVGAVDTDSYIVTSLDGFSWIEQASPAAVALRSVASHGVCELAAVGDTGGGDALILTSDDGATWTEQSNPASYGLYGIAGAQRVSLGGALSYVKES